MIPVAGLVLGLSLITPHAAPHHPPPVPVTRMYDALNSSAIPPNLPKGSIIARYGNGSFAWPRQEITKFELRGYKVVCVDVNATMPRCPVLDVEQYDATPAMAVTWAKTKLRHHQMPVLYTDRNNEMGLIHTLDRSGLRRAAPVSRKGYRIWLTTAGFPRWGNMGAVSIVQVGQHFYHGRSYDWSIVWSMDWLTSGSSATKHTGG